VALAAGALAAWLVQEGASAAPPVLLTGSTARAAMGLAAGKLVAAAVVSARAAALMEGVLRSMFLAKLKTAALVGALATLVAVGVGLWGRSSAQEKADRRGEGPPVRAAEPRTRVALINLAYVVEHDDECKALREAVKKEMTIFQDREKASRDKIEEMSKELSIPGLPAHKREALERALRAERRKMEDLQEEARRKLSRMNDDQTVALYKKVREAATRYAQAHAFELVLQYSEPGREADLDSPANVLRKMQSAGCSPLYAAPGIDISKEIVAVLNARRGQDAPPEGR
jgi:Skp family chaperone for outer membrane proteins